jgi:uncharacterized protein (DUF2252 family)
MTEQQLNFIMDRTERQEAGKGLREQTPRASHAAWTPSAGRTDPLDLLQAQDKGRIQKLLPIKYGRMVASPFAFLRGSAVVMASDLAASPVTGLNTILCGDAHLANFGMFASPERDLVFDINDFDEAYPGPWEWDLKRLAASTVVAGRENDWGAKKCRQMVVYAVEIYRQAMHGFSTASTLDMWYYHVQADTVMKAFASSSKKGEKSAAKVVKKAQFRTQEQTLDKLTIVENGRRRIVSNPPLIIAVRDMGLERFMSEVDIHRLSEQSVKHTWSQYLESLPDERRFLLRRYRLVDVALRVGGVGSVGTRCMIALLRGHDEDDALILQLKEAGPSALQDYLPEQRNYTQHARRVVTGQRLIQAVSDIFLGWHTSRSELQYYWRQLKDMKGSFDVATMDAAGFKTYIGICAFTLARAHARTGDPSAIAGYLGSSDTFARAIADFATAYADQTERDHNALITAIKSGHIVAEIGI